MNKSQKWILMGLLLVCFVLLNWIGRMIPGQWDLTSENQYTLSEGSRALLEELEEPVYIRLYYTESSEGLPVSFQNFAERVKALLGQYARIGGAMVEFESIDPRPDTEEEEAAIRIGLNRQTLPSGDNIMLGLHVFQADQEATIPFFQPQRESYLEYDISRIIYESTRLLKPKLGILTSLSEMEGTPQMPAMMGMPQQGSEPWLIVQELQRTYDLEFLEASLTEIPNDIDVLAVIHPSPLGEAALYAIDQYIMNGRPALFAIDPSSTYQRLSQQPSNPMAGPPGISPSNLDALTEAYGIDFSSSDVVGDLVNGLETGAGANGLPFRNPTFISINDIDSESPIMAQLQDIWVFEAGSLGLNSESTLEMEALLKTSERSGQMMANALQFVQPSQLPRQILTDGEQRVVAARFSGSLKSAFPEGKPEEETGDEDLTQFTIEPLVDMDFVQSTENAQIFVLSDSDLIFDQFVAQRVSFLPGMETYQPMNDNLAFFSNIVDYLAGGNQLMGIRGKGSNFRTFTRVEEMELAAQEKFQAAAEEIENKMRETTQQLQQLQSQQADQRLLIATPEVLEAIENLRNDEANLRSNLREIRKTMREDIEALEITLASINLVAGPVIVLALGAFYFGRRGKRES
ncbi:MAG: GldG family protein [Opitutales bacterium]